MYSWCTYLILPHARFLVPKCHIYLKFSSASAYVSPRATNLNNLAVYALRDSLAQFNYTATTAGAQPSHKPHNRENNLITEKKSFTLFPRTLHVWKNIVSKYFDFLPF